MTEKKNSGKPELENTVKLNQPVRAKKKMRRKKKKGTGAVIAIVLIGILFILGAVGYKGYQYVMGEVAVMKDKGRNLKDELKGVVARIEEKDMDGAEATLQNVALISDDIRSELQKPLWTYAAKFPYAAEKINSVEVLLDVVDEASDTIIRPLFEQLRNNPTDNMKVGDGFNVSIIRSYIDFAEGLEPAIDSIADKLGDIDVSFLDGEGKMTEYQEKLVTLSSHYKELKTDLTAVKTIIGDGSNRFYIFGAQNTAEIRAAGGFLGSVGSIEVYDGILYVGDFRSVYDVMGTYTPYTAGVTDQEMVIFGNQLAIAHDSEYNPDFRRVAEIWTAAYEPYNGVYVDGVISMTPVMIQHLLKLTESEIVLMDGTVLNGDNATYGIEYEIYHKYFNIYSNTEFSDDYTDILFAQTAKQAMEQFTNGFSIGKIMDYYEMFKGAIEDRTLMFWMKDPAEEQIMIDAGMAGVLNPGAPNAVAGVYLSNYGGSKMGIFASIDTYAGEGVRNEDGSISYPVTVTLTNTITYDEINFDSAYILGPYNGVLSSYIHLFAPVGGSITDFNTSNGSVYYVDEYLGLQVLYNLNTMLYPGNPVTLTYTVTTAPGVEGPLTFSTTPTLQEYR